MLLWTLKLWNDNSWDRCVLIYTDQSVVHRGWYLWAFMACLHGSIVKGQWSFVSSTRQAEHFFVALQDATGHSGH